MPRIQAQFELEVDSFKGPDLPTQPPGLHRDTFQSEEVQRQVRATTPLTIVVKLPSAREADPLYPATHLQVIIHYEGSGNIFVPHAIHSQDLVRLPTGEQASVLYEITIPPKDLRRVKVNPEATSDAVIWIDAWRREKNLGRWTAGEIQGLGIVGLKDFELHHKRMEQWEKAREAREGK